MNSTEKYGFVINGAKKRFASHEHYHAFLKDQQHTTTSAAPIVNLATLHSSHVKSITEIFQENFATTVCKVQ